MKKLLLSISFALFFLTLSAFGGGDDDPLHKREFVASFSETRNGVVQRKVISDIIKFKDGKIQSDFLKRKFGFKYIRYRINHDTIYVDETGAEVRLLKLEASATDESNVTVNMQLTQLEWDLDGVVKITRNDRLRKYYDLAAREKHGKPKKIKNKKKDEPENGPQAST